MVRNVELLVERGGPVYLFNVQELGRRMQEGRDGGEGELVWQLSGVEAGGRVEGLAVRCVDEVGRPAAGGVRGRIQVGAKPCWQDSQPASHHPQCKHTQTRSLTLVFCTGSRRAAAH